jgi:Domain of unknown function (DUF6875)
MTTPVLYRTADIARISRDLPFIEQVAAWVDEFLVKPHPDLGRQGSVCPYMPRALAKNLVTYVVVHTANRSPDDIDRVIGQFRTDFLRMEPTHGPEQMDKTIVVILPDVSEDAAPEVIDETHRRLKSDFVESGLMIGKFHPRSEEGGLHNPGFRPLRSPVPLLAIRHMVDSDLPFLNRANDAATDRVRFLSAYGQRFEDNEESRWARKAQEALAEVQETSR